jgi:hypothetical protein
MKRFFAARVVFTLAVISFDSIGHGAEVVAEFDGLVSRVGSAGYGAVSGDLIHGRLRYDTNALATEYLPGAVYYDNVRELSLDILHEGAIVNSLSATGGLMYVQSFSATDGSSRAYNVIVSAGPGLEDDSLAGMPLDSLRLLLLNDNAGPGATTDVPTQLSLSMFDPAISLVDVLFDDQRLMAATITSLEVVPEPSSLAMLIGALPLGYLTCRRRRVAAN